MACQARLSLSWPATSDEFVLVVRAVKGRISEENVKYHKLEGKTVPQIEFLSWEKSLRRAEDK